MILRTEVITTQSEMMQFVDPVWNLLSQAYKSVSGGLNFTTPQQLMESSCQWKIIFQNKNILAITIYKAKHGLKMVAMCINQQFKSVAKKALIKLIKRDLKYCWMELSEAAELFVIKYCQGDRYIMHKSLVQSLLKKTVILNSDDAYHYYRTIKNIRKQKIILGTACFSTSLSF